MSQLLLAHRIRVVDLVAEDQEGHFLQLLHREERVELRLRLGKAFVVFGVDEEDDAADFGEVVFPETTGWMVEGSISHACDSSGIRVGGKGGGL